MKKIILSVIIVSLCCGCSAFNYTSSDSAIDFRNYSNKGFLITPLDNIKVNKDIIQPIGIVEVGLDNIYDGFGKVSEQCKASMKGDEATMSTLQHYGCLSFGVYDYAIARLVNKAVQLGANGIVNFHISFHRDKYNTGRILLSGCAVIIE